MSTTQSLAPPNGAPAVQPATPAQNTRGTFGASPEVALAQIVLSKTNPRKSFDKDADAELISSIKLHGVIQPIVIRPIRGSATGYELVCGERRYRASQAAGKQSIPAIVRNLSDEEALEVQIIENLQRKDVTAIEESAGYVALFAAMQKEQPKVPRQALIDQIAKRIGRSVRYVYARMKLDELIPELKADLAAGSIQPSHCDELVRLCAKDQKDFRSTHLYTNSFGDPAAHDPRVGFANSVRHVKQQIEGLYQNSLKKAPFPTEDAKLIPAAGACGTCIKNSLNSPLVDANKDKPMCMDRACFAEKRAAFVRLDAVKLQVKPGVPMTPLKVTTQHSLPYRRDKSADKPLVRSQWKTAQSASECPHVQPAMVMDVSALHDEAKTAKLVCVDQKCKVHFGPKEESSSRGSARDDHEPKLTLEQTREQHLSRFKSAVEQAVREEAARRAFATVDKLGETELRILVDHFDDYGSDIDFLGLGENLKASDLPRAVMAYCFAEMVEYDHQGTLAKFVKSRGVDLVKVQREVGAALKVCAICNCSEKDGCRLGGGNRCGWVTKNTFGLKALCSNPLCKAEAEKLAAASPAKSKPTTKAKLPAKKSGLSTQKKSAKKGVR